MMALKKNASKYLADLQKKWLELQDTPNVFAYKLNGVKKKFLPGSYKIYAEFNQERQSLRRKPQIIKSLQPEFNENQFNFNKVAPVEILMKIKYKGSEIAMIINKAPLTKFHTLICPDIERNQPQLITSLILDFSVGFLLSISDDRFRIGYNSPGAMASVNHLHMHLLYLDVKLFVEKAEQMPLKKGYISRLHELEPFDAICFTFNESDTSVQYDEKIRKLYEFLIWLIEKNYPHNLIMTKRGNNNNAVQVYVFARHLHHEERDDRGRNVGFCEFAGYVPVGDEMEYECMTEDVIVKRIKREGYEALSDAYEYFKS